MNEVFYVSAVIAFVATTLAVTRTHAVHALLYLIVSLLAVAVIFYVLGAPFVAALEVIVYAGAIMVLFLFVVMTLNLGPESREEERRLLNPGIWVGPTVLVVFLYGELVYLLVTGSVRAEGVGIVDPKQVGIALFGPYVLGVELASLLLLAGIVGAYHLGRREPEPEVTLGEE